MIFEGLWNKKIFLPVGGAHYKDQPPLVVWATPQSKHALKMTFKLNRHSSSNWWLWPLYNRSMEIHILPNMYSIQINDWGPLPCHHPMSFLNKIFTSNPNLRTSAIRPLNILKICWNEEIFLLKSSWLDWFALNKWLVLKYINTSECMKVPSSLGCIQKAISFSLFDMTCLVVQKNVILS